ncbi:hypothetical protein [Winogradskyella aquimaris]|uniref:DUF4136 domain-containing protein n=1 Tax=Winogradskyella aquimaris TaxID=864074 RepID=A0ABU5EMY0_9FLAO|nr:hypothetical protein [Winogradskyella aquimaris]MDY2586124.1 hypothetical protein [Winogradskyella aquimaris]
MKFLLSLLAFVIVTESCNTRRESVAGNTEKLAMEKKNFQNSSDFEIAYRASTRGVFEYTLISKDEVMLTEDRNFEKKRYYPTANDDWKILDSMVAAIDEVKFVNLEAPTSKRHYDGAAHATVTIIRGENELMTPTFDHGHPPKEIEALVNKILTIREKLTKQE